MSERYVILYRRVSTDRQDLARQDATLNALANTLPDGLSDLPRKPPVEDDGVSAFKVSIFDRPGGSAIIQMVREGGVAAICVDHQDRFSRGEQVEWWQFYDLCQRNGTRLFAVEGGEVTNDVAGQMMAALRAAMAREESLNKSHRVKSKLAQLRDQGLLAGGRPPWGYMRDPSGKLLPGSDNRLIRQAFEMYDGGATISEVTRWIRGEPREARARVELDSVSKLLRNPVYAGFIVSDTRTPEPKLIEGKHEPLCGRERWHRVQARLRLNSDTGYKGSKLQPFGPIARCGGCGNVMRHKTLNDRHYGRRDYISCSSPPGSCINPFHIPYEQAEMWVIHYLERMREWIGPALANDEWRVCLGNQHEAARIATELTAVRAGRENIRKAMKAGELSFEEARDDLHDLNRRDQTLQEQYEMADRSESRTRADLERLADQLRFGSTSQELAAHHYWTTTPFEERISKLAAVVKRIVFARAMPSLEAHVETLARLANGEERREILCTREDTLAFRFHGFPLIPLPLVRQRASTALTARLRDAGFGRDSGRIVRSARRGRSGGRSPSPPS